MVESKLKICGAEKVFLTVSLKTSFEGRRNGLWWRANSRFVEQRRYF